MISMAMAKVDNPKPAVAVSVSQTVKADATMTQEKVAQPHAVVLPYQIATKKRMVAAKAQLKMSSTVRRRPAIAAAR